MKKSNKKQAILAVLTLTLTLGLVGCGKLWPATSTNQNTNININQNQNTNQNGNININQNQNADFNFDWATTSDEYMDITDWKTYRNKEYGFEFKYPEKIGDIEFILSAPQIEDYYGLGGKFAVVIRPLIWQDYMYAIVVKEKNFNKEDLIEQLLNSRTDKPLLKEMILADIVINGFYYPSQTNLAGYYFLIEGGNYNYLIIGAGCEELNSQTSSICSKETSLIKIVNSIIKTIKVE